jgi:hypothetical protein
MMYVQPACLSSTAVWIVELSQEKYPDRNSAGMEFVEPAAGVHETAPSISASRANRCLNEFMALKWNWPVASKQSPLVECRVIGVAVMSGCASEHSAVGTVITVIGGVAVGAAGAVYQLGFDRKGGTENYGCKGEFCQSFHGF